MAMVRGVAMFVVLIAYLSNPTNATDDSTNDMLSNSFQQTVLSLQQTVTILQQTVTSIHQIFTNQNSQESVTSLQEAVNNLQQAIANVQQTVNSQQQTMSSLHETVNNQQQAITRQETLIENFKKDGGRGVVYTRWGRTDCPPGNNTHLVYSGFSGGSYFTESGAATNALCMPPDPLWGPHKDTPLIYPAYLYGAEYDEPPVFGMDNHNEDVPCAVCGNSAHSIVSMVPGRNMCYSGWTESYRGLLSTGYPSHGAASEYLCMDGHPESVLGGGTSDDNGKLFYAVVAKCGSLPCPPYEEGKVLSCVVCML